MSRRSRSKVGAKVSGPGGDGGAKTDTNAGAVADPVLIYCFFLEVATPPLPYFYCLKCVLFALGARLRRYNLN